MTISAKAILEEMGTRLHNLLRVLPGHDAITDPMDYVAGALYSLRCAIDAGFADRPGPSDPTYRPFLTKYVLDAVSGRDVNNLWLGGYYFNSALQRIAANYDRMPKLIE